MLLALFASFVSADVRAFDRILTFNGLGSVRIGMTVSEAEAALGAKLTPMDPSNGIDSEACWETSRADNVDPGISYMVNQGNIVRIDVFFPRLPNGNSGDAPSVATENGIRLTSSVEDVKKAYGADLIIDFHSQGDPGNYDLLYMTVFDADKRYGHFFVTWEKGLTSMGTSAAKRIMYQEGCF